MPVALNCFVRPFAILGFVGVTEIDTRVAAVTVRVAEPLIPLAASVAVMVTDPAAMDVARPFEPPALLIVATAVLKEFQVTAELRSCILPSVYVPVAVNCLVVPLLMDGLAGVTAIEDNWADVTVRVVDPLIPLIGAVAAIVVVPVPTDDVRPLLLMVATPVFDELHVTCAVKSCVVLSV